MWTDAQIDSLFTSGYTLTVNATSAPCDPYGADVTEAGEGDGVGGTQLTGMTVLVRASAFPDLDEDNVVSLGLGLLSVAYTVAAPPQRIQDGLVMMLTLQKAEVSA